MLLLLLFFSRFPGVPDDSSSSSPSFSRSLIRSFALSSSDLVEASSIFRPCISASFCPMMRLSRPISSFFSESDFSSLSKRWFIRRKTSSMSVHGLAISDTKIDIFLETTKLRFTSFNDAFAFSKNVKSTLTADWTFEEVQVPMRTQGLR